jgi:hypothetical protein
VRADINFSQTVGFYKREPYLSDFLLPCGASTFRRRSRVSLNRRYQELLWLGHEDPATTHQYIEADLVKEKALRRLQPRKKGTPGLNREPIY